MLPQLNSLRLDKSALMDRLQALTSKQSDVSTRLRELKSDAVAEKKAQQSLDSELKECENQIAEHERSLDAMVRVLLRIVVAGEGLLSLRCQCVLWRRPICMSVCMYVVMALLLLLLSPTCA